MVNKLFWLLCLMGKAIAALCNRSIYIDSTGAEVPIDYVGEPPEYATGPVPINTTSFVTSPSGQTPIDYGSAGSGESFEVIVANDADTDIPYILENSSLSGSVSWWILTNGKVRFNLITNDGSYNSFLAGAIDVRGINAVIGFDIVDAGATFTARLLINGVPDGSLTGISKTGGLVFDKWNLGTNVTFRFEATLYSIKTYVAGVLFRNFNFDTRLKGVNEDSTLIVDSVNGYEMNVSLLESIFPYYTVDRLAFNGATDRVAYQGDSLSLPGKWVDYFQDIFDDLGLSGVTYDNKSLFGANSYIFAEDNYDWASRTHGVPADASRNITKAIADGATIVIYFLGQNDNTQDFEQAETLDLIASSKAECDTNGIDFFVCTIMPRLETDPDDPTGQRAIWANEVSNTIRSTYDSSIIIDINDTFKIEGSDYADPIYLVPDGIHMDFAGYDKAAEIASEKFNAFYGVIPHLKEDRQEIDGTCYIIPAGEAVVYNELTDNAQYNELTGEIQFTKVQ